MQRDIISDDPKVQAHYERCIREGTSPALAEMFALASPPGSQTDREFLRATENGRQFAKTPWIGDAYAAKAKKAGVNTTGKVYKSSLARFPGDPRAWVGGRGDVQKVCEQEGWGCDGAVKVKMQEPEPAGEVAIADDIVERRVAQEIPKGERVGAKERRTIKEKMRNKLKPSWKK